MKPQLFVNMQVFDGTGSLPYPAEVLVEGNLITEVRQPSDAQLDREHFDVHDGGGRTLMPGLVEAHTHISFLNITKLKELGDVPPEEHLLATWDNAKLMLASGFTSLYSAASAKWRTEVVLRNAINSGQLPGPRLKAASPEIVSTGGLGDETKLGIPHQGVEIVADGPDELRKVVRTLIREGVDTIKMNVSGDNSVRPGFARQMSYTEHEIAAAAEEAHARGCWLSCHARADGAVRAALKYGFRVLYHCDFVEGDTFDMLAERKDEIFLAPAIGIIYASAYEAEAWGITKEIAAEREMFTMLENCAKVYGRLREEGLRILPGGDYGFAWNPIGNNARDLEHFVNIIGFSPAEVLVAATKTGGELMNIPNLGLVQKGFLADLLVVDGDPTQDVKLLQDRTNITMIMKDGTYFKRPDDWTSTMPVIQI